MDSYLDNPSIEKEKFTDQPETDWVQNPPTHITIRGVQYVFGKMTQQRTADSSLLDGETFYLVRALGEKIFFWVSDTQPGRFNEALVKCE